MTRRPPPKGRAQGVLLVLALASGVALSALARKAHADSPKRVSIRVPAHAEALLDEALVRVRGELGAMGLGADVQASPEAPEPVTRGVDGAGGTLIIERDGPWIRISAIGPASAAPVVQELDTRRADVTAEVVAVRAVEALRAVMTGLPDRPKTQVPAAKPQPRPAPKAPPPAATGPAWSLAPRAESALSVWAGANALYDWEPEKSALGAELGAFWGRSSFFAGALASTSLLRSTLHDAVGQVYLRRSTASARLGLTFELSHSMELWLLVGAGVARYGIEGKPATGYVGVNGHHDSPMLAASVGAIAWLSQNFSGYLRFESAVATDAPAVRVTLREIAVLERPTLGASLGVVLRAPRSWVP